ncbi:MAG: fibronectin type III domain-containing protein [Endomicrobiales bacterium]|nr:fibronectin type III domain-containing protein [Endomicrobiales bacterium]
MKYRITFLTMILCLFTLPATAAPAKSGGVYEITVENIDCGGDPTPGYSGGTYEHVFSFCEPGGITKLTAGTYELFSGYFGQDLTPPVKINDLDVTLNKYQGALNLSWSAPGDDLTQHQLLGNTKFYIATTTVLTDAQNIGYWYGRRNAGDCEVIITTANVNYSDGCYNTMLDLFESATYFIRIWTLDQAANWSEVSNGATIQYFWSPAAVTSLNARQGIYGRYVTLNWSAPGDDGWNRQLINGSQYAVQRSTWAEVFFSTDSVDTVRFSTSSVNSGDYQAYNLTSLIPGVTYYVRLWTADEWGNWSDISNSTNAWATITLLAVSLDPHSVDFSNVDTDYSTHTPVGVENTGNVIQTYTIRSGDSVDWTLASSQGEDAFRLRAAFHDDEPLIADYDANDNVLTTSDKTASSTVLTIDGSHVGSGVDPFTDDTRTVWFQISTPLSVSNGNEQTITVIVTAQESP